MDISSKIQNIRKIIKLVSSEYGNIVEAGQFSVFADSPSIAFNGRGTVSSQVRD